MKPEDYENYEQNVLQAIMEFNTLFSDYIKQMDPNLWERAVDYAEDFAKSGNISFNYTSDKTPELILSNLLSQTIFIKELVTDLDEVREEYMNFVEENSKLPTPKIMEKWLNETGNTQEDPFGYENDLKMFIGCNHKFTFAEFDEEDWFNYTNIVVSCVQNKEFQREYTDILLNALSEKSDIYQYYIRCMEEQDNV
jgi:hypothetical protein